jgi:hypothetical protein
LAKRAHFEAVMLLLLAQEERIANGCAGSGPLVLFLNQTILPEDHIGRHAVFTVVEENDPGEVSHHGPELK